MEEGNTAIIVGMFFMARCLVPLLIMFGISYLLKRLGYIKESPSPPSELRNGGDEHKNGNTEAGSLKHGTS
jgi:hypothetical protein